MFGVSFVDDFGETAFLILKRFLPEKDKKQFHLSPLNFKTENARLECGIPQFSKIFNFRFTHCRLFFINKHFVFCIFAFFEFKIRQNARVY